MMLMIRHVMLMIMRVMLMITLIIAPVRLVIVLNIMIINYMPIMLIALIMFVSHLGSCSIYCNIR